MKKLMVAVEYFDEYHGKNDDDNHSTMEIFETIGEAYGFAISGNVKFCHAFIADFDRDSIYLEAEDNWNYDDNGQLFENSKRIEFYNILKYE